MCQDGAGKLTGGPTVRPGAPSRRAFGRLLAAGSGLAAVAACTPVPAPQPSPLSSISTATATPAASPSAAPPPSDAAPPPSAATGTATAGTAPSASASGPQHSLTDPASPWVVVNKHRALSPASYVPADLIQPAVRLAVSGEAALLNSTTAAAAEKMFTAAAADGVTLALASGYRSFTAQANTYASYVSSKGQAEADTVSARPGYSEHQTGWSFDLVDGGGACSFQPCFAEQPAAVWARNNAHRFGFVVRYPWMFHAITGYYYEPWHLRYIGSEAAADMRNRAIATLEEYFGLEAAPAYR